MIPKVVQDGRNPKRGDKIEMGGCYLSTYSFKICKCLLETLSKPPVIHFFLQSCIFPHETLHAIQYYTQHVLFLFVLEDC